MEVQTLDGLIEALTSVLDSNAMLVGDDIPHRNRTDWSFLPETTPFAVCRPSTTEDVALILRSCNAAGVVVTPQGGMTGLCGGARPIDGGFALSMERMVGIDNIDPDGMTMTVRAGTPLEVIQKAADDAGLFFALDLGARGSCAIGGNLSTNAGGNRVIRYGMARDLVLGLEVVLPDGTVLPMLNRMLKNNAGYDLKQLFLGAEGTLGVITRAVLRLHPKPGCVCAAMCVVSGYDKVLELLGAARGKLGPFLSAFEVMWADYWSQATERVSNAKVPVTIGDGTHVVLVEMQGLDEEIDSTRFSAWLEQMFEAGVIGDCVIAQNLSDMNDFWSTRDAAAEFANPAVIGPHISFDIGLPIRRIEEFVSRSKPALMEELGCHSVHYGHVGDGNIHIVAWVPGAKSQPLSDASRIVYGIVGDLGGTVSAEHGIGLLKKPYLKHTRDQTQIELMQRIKRCVDPAWTLNPTKIFD